MKRIAVLRVGNVDRGLAQRLCASLAAEFATPCDVLAQHLDPLVAFHPERQQYQSTELLCAMQPLAADAWRILAVADIDLFIPVLTFVFGEAQLNGSCAVISTHRLRQEAYGLPASHELLFQRTLKEAVHELGHTLGLSHCDDYECAMAASHSVEWIDTKGASLCSACHAVAFGDEKRQAGD